MKYSYEIDPMYCALSPYNFDDYYGGGERSYEIVNGNFRCLARGKEQSLEETIKEVESRLRELEEFQKDSIQRRINEMGIHLERLKSLRHTSG